jgi:hypothetical protein
LKKVLGSTKVQLTTELPSLNSAEETRRKNWGLNDFVEDEKGNVILKKGQINAV